MKLIFTLLSTLLFNILQAQDSLTILFIGNSYTYVNDLPSVTNSITTSLGDKLTFDSRTQGGASFAVHVGNASTYTSIHSKPWDYVVIQGQSQELSFPTSQVNTDSEPFIEQLADSIHASKYCSQIFMFMTWGRQNGDPQWDSIATYNGMQERLTNTAERMADSINSSISPVGVAWKYVRDHYPAINLYNADQSHPSYEGTYLAGCVFYASLFRKPSLGATFIGSLDATTAGILQAAADLTVLDSLDKWNLHALSDQTVAQFSSFENGTSITFTNESINANSYHWDFGDGQTSTDLNPSNSYASNGTYTIELIALDSCDSDTLTLQLIINNAGLNTISQQQVLLKNLQNNYYKIETSTLEEFEIGVFDLLGNTVCSSNLLPNELIDLNFLNQGIYYITLKIKGQNYSFKVIKN
jgi:hypothetical protein